MGWVSSARNLWKTGKRVLKENVSGNSGLVIDRTIIFNPKLFYAQSLGIAITEIGKL
jgi:hypothetical protein